MSSQLTRIHDALTAGLCAIILPSTLCAAAQAETIYFHRDHLGSLVATSDAASNFRTGTGYRPWGESNAVSSGTDTDDYTRFTGKARDSASGLYYFGARYYDAGLGRFLSPDPARQTRSPYAYAGSAPLVNVDPGGRNYSFLSKLYEARQLGPLHTPGQMLSAVRYIRIEMEQNLALFASHWKTLADIFGEDGAKYYYKYREAAHSYKIRAKSLRMQVKKSKEYPRNELIRRMLTRRLKERNIAFVTLNEKRLDLEAWQLKHASSP